MFEKTEKELDISMDLAIKFREEKGMENPEDVSVSPYYDNDGKITKVNPESGQINYNIRSILEAPQRRDQTAEVVPNEIFRGPKTMDERAESIVFEWNNQFSLERVNSYSVAVIFHSLEEILFRRSVRQQENTLFEEFVEEAIPSKIRNEIFYRMDSQSSKVDISDSLPKQFQRYFDKYRDLPSVEDYQNCLDLISFLDSLEARELHEMYNNWDDATEIIES